MVQDAKGGKDVMVDQDQATSKSTRNRCTRPPKTGGNPELVMDQQSRLLFPPGDSDSWTNVCRYHGGAVPQVKAAAGPASGP